MAQEVYISVDIEADGAPVPDFSMVSIGAKVVRGDDRGFYAELRRLPGSQVNSEAAKVHGLTDAQLENAFPPEVAMSLFRSWINKVSGDRKPVFVGFNASFDWKYVDYYLLQFSDCETSRFSTTSNPFFIRCLDIKSYYAGLMRVSYSKTTKSGIEKRFLSTTRHTHNAKTDAIEQAEVFEKMLDYAERMRRD